jgi:hypothetical protein
MRTWSTISSVGMSPTPSPAHLQLINPALCVSDSTNFFGHSQSGLKEAPCMEYPQGPPGTMTFAHMLPGGVVPTVASVCVHRGEVGRV